MKVLLRVEYVENRMARENVTLRELSRRAGMSCGYLSMVLQRRRCLGPRARARLMEVFEEQDWDALFEIVRDGTTPERAQEVKR